MSNVGRNTLHHLPATPGTIHWGYFDPSLEPVLTVRSGDLVRIEALTHHAGDAPDLLMDEGIERVFAEVDDRGPGPHLLTGPIAVAGARGGRPAGGHPQRPTQAALRLELRRPLGPPLRRLRQGARDA